MVLHRLPANENDFAAKFQKWQGEREKDLSAQPMVSLPSLLLKSLDVCQLPLPQGM